MKVLSSFLSPIPLDEKRRRNRGALGEKASSKAAFLILPLQNSSEDALLLLPLHQLIVSSSFCLPVAKSGVGVFGKDNAGKGRRGDPRSIGTDGGIGADNSVTRTDVDAGADNPGTTADNSGIATDDPGTATDNSGIAADNVGTTADNLGIGMDADAGTNNPGIAAEDLDTEMDADTEANDSGTAASNNAHTRAASLFGLHCALFLLAFSSKSVTASF